MKAIYKVTYPNCKIYIGKAIAGEVTFANDDIKIIEQDFTKDELRDFTIRKEILWESDSASDEEVRSKEIEFITAFKSHDPAIVYNRWPNGADDDNRCP
jgi:hypothetical protein